MSKRSPLHTGMSLREAYAFATEHGCTITNKPATGETTIHHPRLTRHFCTNNRRKDSSQAMVSWLRKVELATEPATA